MCDDYGPIAAERPGRSTCLAGARPRPPAPGSVAFPGWGGGRGTRNGGRTKRALWIEWTPNRDPPSCHQIPSVDGRRLAVTQPPPVLQRKKRVSRIVTQTKAGPIRSGEAATGVEVGGRKKKKKSREERTGVGQGGGAGGQRVNTRHRTRGLGWPTSRGPESLAIHGFPKLWGRRPRRSPACRSTSGTRSTDPQLRRSQVTGLGRAGRTRVSSSPGHSGNRGSGRPRG